MLLEKISDNVVYQHLAKDADTQLKQNVRKGIKPLIYKCYTR
jgi:hypothetical protein